VVLKPLWRDTPVLALMISETVIWAAIFYSFPALVLLWQGEYGWSATIDARRLQRGAGGAGAGGAAYGPDHRPGRCAARDDAWHGRDDSSGLAALTQVTVLWQFYLGLGVARA
jgi:hypothetical protein